MKEQSESFNLRTRVFSKEFAQESTGRLVASGREGTKDAGKSPETKRCATRQLQVKEAGSRVEILHKKRLKVVVFLHVGFVSTRKVRFA